MRSASEFRQMARETLRGNWKLAMGTGLAASLIGAEIADTAPNGISELQKVIQARPEVKNVLTQVFLMRSMLLPLVLLLIWGLMVVIIGGAGQMGYALFLPFDGRRESGWNRKRVDDGRIPQSAGSGR